jgi:hypothetical protein
VALPIGPEARPTHQDRVPSGEPCVLRGCYLIACRRGTIGLIAQLGFAAIPIVRLARPSALIGRILTYRGLDPQPPPSGKAREAGHEFAA